MTKSLRHHRYLHYDVFTDKPLTGNQLAVFTHATDMTAGDMARVTLEMNFSECTFVQPAEQAETDVRLRTFGLDGEMPFAGHPVIGSTFALAHEGFVKPPKARLVLGLGIGATPVDLEWKGSELAFVWMTQRPPNYGPTLDARDRMTAVLGIEPAAICDGLPIQEVSCGLPFLFVPLTSRAAVDRCELDPRANEAMFRTPDYTSRHLRLLRGAERRRRHGLQPNARRGARRSGDWIGERAARLLSRSPSTGAARPGGTHGQPAGREDGQAEPGAHPDRGDGRRDHGRQGRGRQRARAATGGSRGSSRSSRRRRGVRVDGLLELLELLVEPIGGSIDKAT